MSQRVIISAAQRLVITSAFTDLLMREFRKLANEMPARAVTDGRTNRNWRIPSYIVECRSIAVRTGKQHVTPRSPNSSVASRLQPRIRETRDFHRRRGAVASAI